MVLHIATRKDAWHVRLSRTWTGQNVSRFVHLEPPPEDIRVRLMPDCYKETLHRQGRRAPSLYVLEHEPFDFVFPHHILHHGVPHNGNPFIGKGPLLHDLGGAQSVTPVNDMHPRGKARQKQRFLHRGIPSPDNGHFLPPEESPITGCTG